MKKTVGSFAAAVIYLILMCFLLGKDIFRLFDAGLLGMLLLGSIILCLPHLESRGNYCTMKGIFAKNALMTGYIETFMLLFVSLQSVENVSGSLLSRVALDFRPLFYGFICYLLLGREAEPSGEEPAAEDQAKEAEMSETEEGAGAEEQSGGEEKSGTKAKSPKEQEEQGEQERKAEREVLSRDGTPEENRDGKDLSVLSRRERQVAELVKRGLSNREIGEELYISEATVKKHVSHIFEKLEIESRKDIK